VEEYAKQETGMKKVASLFSLVSCSVRENRLEWELKAATT
jgi:hypothetical protein